MKKKKKTYKTRQRLQRIVLEFKIYIFTQQCIDQHFGVFFFFFLFLKFKVRQNLAVSATILCPVPDVLSVTS